MSKRAKVVHGPGCWLDKTGDVLFEDAEWVVVRLESLDDAGRDSYNVRMPLLAVTFVVDPAK